MGWEVDGPTPLTRTPQLCDEFAGVEHSSRCDLAEASVDGRELVIVECHRSFAGVLDPDRDARAFDEVLGLVENDRTLTR